MKIRIAVLPLINRDESSIHISDGISEAIIFKLAEIPELIVTSRSSSFQFRNSDIAASKIFSELEIDIAVDGTFRIVNDQIRISLNIISASDSIVWSKTWNANTQDLLQLEDEMIGALTESIRDQFTHFDLLIPFPNKASDISVEDYKTYLKANQLQYNWSIPDGISALDLYDSIILDNPNFYDAYVRKIGCLIYLKAVRGIDDESAEKQIIHLLGLLEQSAYSSADLHVVKAGRHFWSWNFDSAIKEIQHCLKANPSHSEAYNLLGLMYGLSGLENQSFKHFEIALNLDPLSANKYATKAWAMYTMGQFKEAIDSFHNSVSLNPIVGEGAFPIYIKSKITLNGNYQNLLTEISSHSTITHITRTGLLAIINIVLGKNKEAENFLKTLWREFEIDRNNEALSFLAQAYCAFGKFSQAIDILETLVESKYPLLVGQICDPVFNPLKSDSRFKRIFNLLKPLKQQVVLFKKPPKKRPSQKWVTEFKLKVEELVHSQKVYLQPSLTLRQLAEMVETTPNNLSWLINNEFQSSFNDYINKQRVEEFKRKVANPNNSNFSLLGLALESGFNSKASFNTIFKKATGITPREYQKSLDQ